MRTRVLFISCGATPATRRSAFPLDEPLIEDGETELRERFSASRRWARHVAPGAPVLAGPELRCRQTADALGLVPVPPPAPADWNLGTWAGHTLDELLATGPASVRHWLTDPTFEPPGGEPLTAFLARVSRWLDAVASPPSAAPRAAEGAPGDAAPAEARGLGGAAPSSSAIVVICTPAVVRAALTSALQAPPATFWRLDAAPLSTAELTGFPAHWSARL